MSGETEWTPGPWLPYRANTRTLVTVPVRSGGFKCMVIDQAGANIVAEARGLTEAEAQANARLIAAAPDLFAVLSEAVVSNSLVDNPDWWGRVFAALAKARGEQS